MEKGHQISVWKIVLAIVLLAGSSFIYLVFRPDNIIGYRLVQNLGLSGVLNSLRAAFSGVHIPGFVNYSLPDGLWLVSYMLLTDTLLPDHPTKPIWILALPANAIVSEAAQYFHLLPGNFDVWDLVCYVVPTALYLVFRKAQHSQLQHSFDEVMSAPLLLVVYLFLAGCSVDRLDMPFVFTCAIYASALMVLNYSISRSTSIINKR